MQVMMLRSKNMTMFGYNVLGFGSFALSVPATSVEYLVVAGGAGGAGAAGGGGGAGGYRNSYNNETSGGNSSSENALVTTIGTEYTITVGAGGAGTGTWSLQQVLNRCSILGYGYYNYYFRLVVVVEDMLLCNGSVLDGGSGGGARIYHCWRWYSNSKSRNDDGSGNI
jgi:hypothetical protein